jgi:hypothetical protein
MINEILGPSADTSKSIDKRVFILERDVKELKKGEEKTQSLIKDLREQSEVKQNQVLEAISKVSDEQLSQGKKLGFLRGTMYSVLIAGGGTGATAAATDGEKLIDFVLHIVEYF